MNRWHVYNYLKYRYMNMGEIPNMRDILDEFPGIDTEELGEGLAEFHSVLARGQITVDHQVWTERRRQA